MGNTSEGARRAAYTRQGRQHAKELGAKEFDDGIYVFDCLICGEEFYWGDSNDEPIYLWCHDCKEKQITGLQLKVSESSNHEVNAIINELELALENQRVYNEGRNKGIKQGKTVIAHLTERIQHYRRVSEQPKP